MNLKFLIESIFETVKLDRFVISFETVKTGISHYFKNVKRVLVDLRPLLVPVIMATVILSPALIALYGGTQAEASNSSSDVVITEDDLIRNSIESFKSGRVDEETNPYLLAMMEARNAAKKHHTGN